MVLFRPQRELLADSMAEMTEVQSWEDINILIAPYYVTAINPYGGIDHRIGWDTYIVKASHPEDDDCFVMGFTNGPLAKG